MELGFLRAEKRSRTSVGESQSLWRSREGISGEEGGEEIVEMARERERRRERNGKSEEFEVVLLILAAPERSEVEVVEIIASFCLFVCSVLSELYGCVSVLLCSNSIYNKFLG